MAYCTNCGSEIGEHNSFCSHCGKTLEEIKKPAKVSSDRKGKLVQQAAVTLIVIIGIAAAGYFFLFNGVRFADKSSSDGNTPGGNSVENIAIGEAAANSDEREKIDGTKRQTVIKHDNHEAFNVKDATIVSSSNFSESISGQQVVYKPSNLIDDDKATAWVEGVEGSGIGEWVMFQNDEEALISSIALTNGFTKSADLYDKNNRVKDIKIEFSNGEAINVQLSDGITDLQEITLENPILTDYVKFTIMDTYPGSNYDDTCISEILFNYFPETSQQVTNSNEPGELEIEVELTTEEKRDFNIFFSNFSEVYLEPFQRGQISNNQLIYFGYFHNEINNFNRFKVVEDQYQLAAKYVEESVDKFFDKRVAHESVDKHLTYKNGQYYFPISDGAGRPFSQIVNLIDSGNDTYSANVNVYSEKSFELVIMDAGVSYLYNPLEDWDEKYKDDIELIQKINALIKKVRENGKTRYILVEYLEQ